MKLAPVVGFAAVAPNSMLEFGVVTRIHPAAVFVGALAPAGWVLLANPTAFQKEAVIRAFGFPAVALTLVGLIGALFACRKAMAGALGRMRTADWLLVALVFAFIAASLPWRSRTLMDEGVLLGISKRISESGVPAVPVVSFVQPDGSRATVVDYVDKRPLLAPSMFAVIHDLTGYRPINGIAVNLAAAALFLLLAWQLGFAIGGAGAARGAVLLWATVPLLPMAATCAGMEMLNLTLLTGEVLLLIAFLKEQSAGRAAGLVYGALLLAQARYESMIFLLPVGLALGAVVWRRPAGWNFVWLAPAPLLFVPALFIRSLATGASWDWEIAERGAQSHFALGNIPANAQSALAFLFDTGLRHGNSVFVLMCGLGLAPLALRQWLAMMRRGGSAASCAMGVGAFTVCTTALLPVILCYYWGDLRDPAAARLALVLYFPLVVSALLGGAWLAERCRAWSVILPAAGIFAMVWTSAILAQKRHDDFARDVNQWNWLADRITASSPETLWVLPTSLWPIVHGRDAILLDAANADPDGIRGLMESGRYQCVAFVELFRVMPPDATLVQSDRTTTSPRFTLDTVAEYSGQPFWVQRVSRLKSVQ